MKRRSRLHKPSAEAAGGGDAAALKEEAAFLSADHDGIAVQQAVLAGGTERADVFNPENAPVRPGNGPGQHITGGVKIGRDLDVNPVRHDTDILSIHKIKSQ